MNRTLPILLLLTLALTGLQGCKKEEKDLDLNLAAANALFAPSDNLFVKLQPATSASIVFEWEQAKAEDGTLVMYQIAFDKENGDFSNPIAKQLSDGGGAQNRLTLSHKDMNRIASQAGIPSLGTGKLTWTVLSSKGPNIVKAQGFRTVEVNRPAGFADIPAAVYLSGSATESGADPAQAIAMKKVSDGVFEVYTSLKDGNLQILDKASADAKGYSLADNFSALKENGETAISGGAKVYRISLDFSNAAAKLTEIKEVGLWYCIDNDIRFTLDYAGGGVWRALDKKIDFPSVPWGVEERYKFRLAVNDGVADSFEWLGSINADNSRPDASTPASFYLIFPIATNDQWNYAFKFPLTVNGKNNDVTLLLKPDAQYTHQIMTK